MVPERGDEGQNFTLVAQKNVPLEEEEKEQHWVCERQEAPMSIRVSIKAMGYFRPVKVNSHKYCCCL